MVKKTIHIQDEHAEVFLNFIKTINYVKVVDDSDLRDDSDE